jgi:hypothetical protein
VFVYGNPGSSRDWARLMERTGAVARAVAWDHPEFGRADKPAGFDYTVPGYAAHLGRCLKVLGITRAHCLKVLGITRAHLVLTTSADGRLARQSRRRSGCSSGTSTMQIRTPSGSAIHISSSPHGSRLGSRRIGTPRSPSSRRAAASSRTCSHNAMPGAGGAVA